MHNIGAKVMFIEVNNEDEDLLASQYRSTVQHSADYAGLNDVSSVRIPIRKLFCSISDVV